MTNFPFPPKLRSKLNEIQQEVVVGTWDNVILALTLFILGVTITLIITGISNLSPNWLLIVLLSIIFLWFLLQNFTLLLDSIFSKKNRFTNKSRFISFNLSFLILLILLIGLPYLLFQILGANAYASYLKGGTIGFYLLMIIVYATPVILFFVIHPRIKRFFKNNCPSLILKSLSTIKKEDKDKLLKNWGTSIPELKKLDREY